MTIQSVLKMGHPQLATPSQTVVDFSVLDTLIQDMKDTMLQERGIGIAAPQIGCNLRVIIFGSENNQRYPAEDAVPFTILINPVITPLTSDMVDGWEGCLSVPGMRGLVARYQKIKYSGVDAKGHVISRVAEGFHARVVQHECDHLDGILYPQRLKDMRYFGFEDSLDI